MIKMVAAMRRKPGMTHAECLQYVEHTHGAISRIKPLGLKKYMQNHVFDGAFGAESDTGYHQTFHRDSITELYFDDYAGLIETFSDPHTQQKVGPDGANFADLTRQAAQLMSEREIKVPTPGKGGVKVMHFLKQAPGVDLLAFVSAWEIAHQAAQQQCPEFAQAVRRHVRAEYIPEGDRITAYFGPDIEVHQGLASFWFEDERDLTTFRAYQRLLMRLLGEDGVVEPQGSFFVYAREVSIIGGEA
ncbi:EthD domain-containing protein [Pseudomonas sp. App30]|uniref:EthD domain-containing protein n=1 Tax=Pseudomonas sp. App30 TaxID=3068990 RepID=UPI003A806124